MSNMFAFTASRYTDAFAEQGFVHIPGGLTEEFHAQLVRYVKDSFDEKHLKDFARGDKQQAMFEFLEPSHYDELREAVATITGVPAANWTLSERHIKEYEPGANPKPLAHKDRFGSEVSVGFSILVPEGSTLIIYPDHDLTANPFNSSAELRLSFPPDGHPEPGLRRASRVEIQDGPRDVQLFLGNSMWHLRENGAGTTVLYLKLNTYNCDTLGEDPHSEEVRRNTLRIVDGALSEWPVNIPVVSRAVDYIHQRYSRDWSDLFGVVLYGQPHATVTRSEFEALRLMDGRRTIGEISREMEQSNHGQDVQESIRRLARRGIVDVLTVPMPMGQVHRTALAEAR